jgi:hypothetical protein
MALKAMPESPEPEGTGEVRRGHRRREPPSPAVLAVRLENLQRGYRAWRGRKDATKAALEVAMAELPYEELWQRVKPRMTSAVLLYLLGYDYPKIAAALGYSGKRSSAVSVQQLLRRPEAQRLIREIRAEQLKRTLSGEYGAQAVAKAASATVMSHVATLAGAQTAPTGERVGRAARDRDALTAAKLVFEVSGERVERHAHLHLHILQDMTDAELEQLANTGQFPERFQTVQAMLPPDPDALMPSLNETKITPPRDGRGA